MEKQQPFALHGPRPGVHLRGSSPGSSEHPSPTRGRRRASRVGRATVRHDDVKRDGDAAQVGEQRGEGPGFVQRGDDDTNHESESAPSRRASAGAKLSSTRRPPAIATRTNAPRVASREPLRIASAKNVYTSVPGRIPTAVAAAKERHRSAVSPEAKFNRLNGTTGISRSRSNQVKPEFSVRRSRLPRRPPSRPCNPSRPSRRATQKAAFAPRFAPSVLSSDPPQNPNTAPPSRVRTSPEKLSAVASV